MDPRHKTAKADPTDQGGRPFMITMVPILIILALAVLVGVYFLAK